jgi:alanyl-tRNA synthetase
MGSERRYYDDSYTTRFETRVAALGEHGGRPAVELEATYFYPESGGQLADRGTLGGTPVVDVQADGDGRVWHLLEPAAPVPGGEVTGEIDWARRFDHMQQHTGQHILSAAFERVAGAATLSCHLGVERSSIEVAIADADREAVARVERAANAVVWEDRPVERHWTDPEGVKRFALRKPPAVEGRIRIVEIPDWDVSACGGTHTRRTGEVGIVKVVRWEKVRGNLRFEFLCGARALQDHAWRLDEMSEAAKRRTLADREVIAHLERAAAERDELARRLRELSLRALAAEARARVGEPPRGVAEISASRTREEVRAFAIQCLEAGAPWVVSASTAEPSLVAARGKGEAGDLKSLLAGLLAHARGKGGGSPDFLQVGCADAAAAVAAFESARDAVPGVVGGRAG